MKMFWKNKGLWGILFCTIILLLFVAVDEACACTYDEALNSNWGNYPISRVKEILQEDISIESTLAPNQKENMLIGDMRNSYSEFDKVSSGIKYEALCAISALETGHFSSDLCKRYNNVGGMRGKDGYLVYDTKEQGIQALSQLLSEQYLNSDGSYYCGNTIIDVSKHYNPSVHFVNLYVKIRIDMENRIQGIEPVYPEPEIEKCFLCNEKHTGLCQLHDIMCNTYNIERGDFYGYFIKKPEKSVG